MSMGASSVDASSMDTGDTMMQTDSGTATSTSQPIIQVNKMLMMKKKNAVSKPQNIISFDEEQLNPQWNQQSKKLQKAQQKKARRQAEGGNTSNNLMEEDDDMQEEFTMPTATSFQFNTSLMSAPIPDEDEEL